MSGSDLSRIAKFLILVGGILTAGLVVSMGALQAQLADQEDFPGVRLRALNKLTAQLVVMDVALEVPTEFGSLTILVHACRKPKHKEEDDSVAFLEIHDRAADNNRVFMGWMFASSPSLSALEHPLYDVWVEKCSTS